MENEQIRIRIAESLGLEVIHDPRGPIDTRPSPYTLKRKVFYTPTAAAIRRKSWPKASTVPVIPNYPEDLNACAEFEATLSDDELEQYREHISVALNDVCRMGYGFTAKAIVRCLAYLAVKGIDV